MKDKDRIDSLRQYLGTLPARTNSDDWLEPRFVRGIAALKVLPVSPVPSASSVVNFYKALFAMATATWGDANIDGNWANKWDTAEPEARYAVVWNVLHFQTLPTAMESVQFTFEVVGGPRHFFDQVARTRLGAGFASIGCRDNSKQPAETILYGSLYDIVNSPSSPEEEAIATMAHDYSRLGKSLYQALLNHGSGSYQMARAFLPMNYHHQFSVTQNLLSMIGAFARRSCLGEEEFIVAYAYRMRQMLQEAYGLTMVADIMRPTCHRTKKCHYAGTMSGGGVPGLFSNLFAPKDPNCLPFVPADAPEYAEFNMSCTNSDELVQADVGYVPPGCHMDLPVDYGKARPMLSGWEIEAFES